MVWGGISIEGRTELEPVNDGRLNADRYRTNTLDRHVVPYIGDNSALMHDNARLHVAWVVR